jgi:hypothetical protein
VDRVVQLYASTGDVTPRYNGRCGRRSTISTQARRHILLEAKRQPHLTSKEIHHLVPNIGHITTRHVRNILRRGGLRCYRPLKKPLLTAKQMSARLEWARRYQEASMDFWKKVSWLHGKLGLG